CILVPGICPTILEFSPRHGSLVNRDSNCVLGPVTGDGRFEAKNLSKRQSATRTKPLTRRTLPRVLTRRVVAGLADKVRVTGGTCDPTTPDDVGGTPAPQLRREHDPLLHPLG